VFAPKLATLEQWQQLQRLQPAAAQVLFSSVASLLGSPGQLNYSAANAVLDGAAAASQDCGMAAVSVQWGAWAGAGMAASDAQTAARVARLGMGMVGAGQGLAALEGVLAGLGSGGCLPTVNCVNDGVDNHAVGAFDGDWRHWSRGSGSCGMHVVACMCRARCQVSQAHTAAAGTAICGPWL
jgi:hypothetical protein